LSTSLRYQLDTCLGYYIVEYSLHFKAIFSIKSILNTRLPHQRFHTAPTVKSPSLSLVNRFTQNLFFVGKHELGAKKGSRQAQKKQKLLYKFTRLQIRINYDSFFFVLQATFNPAVHVELIELFTPEGTHIKLRRRSFDAARLCKNDRKKETSSAAPRKAEKKICNEKSKVLRRWFGLRTNSDAMCT
jgi:hypothetical protein